MLPLVPRRLSTAILGIFLGTTNASCTTAAASGDATSRGGFLSTEQEQDGHRSDQHDARRSTSNDHLDVAKAKQDRSMSFLRARGGPASDEWKSSISKSSGKEMSCFICIYEPSQIHIQI